MDLTEERLKNGGRYPASELEWLDCATFLGAQPLARLVHGRAEQFGLLGAVAATQTFVQRLGQNKGTILRLDNAMVPLVAIHIHGCKFARSHLVMVQLAVLAVQLHGQDPANL